MNGGEVRGWWLYPEAVADFSRRIRRQGEHEIWTGSVNTGSNGQPWLFLHGKWRYASRLAMERHLGRTLNGSQERVSNTCGVTLCVRAEHHTVGRGLRSKLSDADVAVIRAALSRGVSTQSELARRFGVSPAMINMIARGNRRAGRGNQHKLQQRDGT